MKPWPPPSSSSSSSTILSHFALFGLIFSAVVIYLSALCYVSRLYDHHRPLPHDGKRISSFFLIIEHTLFWLIFSHLLVLEMKHKCDIYGGRWVRDFNQPSYEESDCPYMDQQLTCLRHGRPDKDYRYWRWQPNACSIPRSIFGLLLHFISLLKFNNNWCINFFFFGERCINFLVIHTMTFKNF